MAPEGWEWVGVGVDGMCSHVYTYVCVSVYLGTEYSRQKVWLLRRFWFRKYWLSCSLEEAKELSNCPQAQKGIIRISLWSQLHFGQLAKRDLVRLLRKSENVRLWFAGTNSQYRSASCGSRQAGTIVEVFLRRGPFPCSIKGVSV